jgi:hypothetical protein
MVHQVTDMVTAVVVVPVIIMHVGAAHTVTDYLALVVAVVITHQAAVEMVQMVVAHMVLVELLMALQITEVMAVQFGLGIMVPDDY